MTEETKRKKGIKRGKFSEEHKKRGGVKIAKRFLKDKEVIELRA